MNNMTKPKLVFFQWNHQDTSIFVQMHMKQHVKCLSEFFEVIVINEDCDYRQICDKYQPDLTLFESGVSYSASRRLYIKNTSAYSEIPKLGLHNGDPWCIRRAGFISDMENWGIETFFSTATTIGEHTPEIAENLLIWPNFIDADIYRDYGQKKIIPILINGSTSNLYPWRQTINKIISQNYPSLICPHLGYSKPSEWRMLYGEQYARTINTSWFAPTCGTVAKEVLRKHFEIPGSKSCLITEKSPTLEAAGFIDMQNCVFADEHDILDKLNYLFQHQDELEKITNAGYQLVHSRHTLKQRDQIFQWYNLYKNLKPSQKIVQSGLFQPLTIVEKSSDQKSYHIICNGLDISLINQGDEKLWAGKYNEAEVLYLKCLNYISWMPEPKLKLALCNLYKGNAKTALDWIAYPIKDTLENYKASTPDPVEWSYFLIILICQGKLNEAIKHSEQFPSLSHPELNRTRWIIKMLKNKEYILPPIEQTKYRATIHQLPNRNLNEWIGNIYIMLTASGQFDLREQLREIISLKAQDFKKENSNFRGNKKFFIKSSLFTKITSLFSLPSTVEPIHILFKNRLKRLCGNFLRRLECRFGYFLPYHVSEKRNDELFHTIQYLTQSENIKTALIIGASNREGSTEAFLTGIQQNFNKPSVFCINIPLPQFIKLQKQYANHSVVKCYQLSSASQKNFTHEIENVIQKIKQENKLEFFDIVLVDGSELSARTELYNELQTVKFIILDDINSGFNQPNYFSLATNKTHIVDTENISLRNGYAIFKKI
ncbi:glycosyltransferase family 1 protein [Anabaena sphaerica FACHB-251]|uniref:Glycosyltransferase family 1 protein n=1 Tax=Anabaena sphaerica FACHB-251 TaxID=2692883 RepID=A0A926WN57_9NOST|nr:glycosyltransferase [Anabaena sphaerica]MBD2296486.1 glycosyltransferase family 1 protein [Anabaena sphaerica FACHB-251]